MTTGLRDGLREIADTAPRLTVPADLYERGRRVRRRRRATGAAAALVVVAATAFGVYAPSRSATIAPANSAGTRLPSVVVSPPRFTADLVHAPVAPALVVYAGGESAHTEGFSGDEYPLTVVGPDDAYRSYDRPEWTSFGDGLPTFLLSPNGRYILMSDTTPGLQSASRLLDLTTGDVRVLTLGTPIVWSPDGRLAVFMRNDATGEDIGVVSMASDRMVWSDVVTQRVAENTTAAFAADGSLAILDGAELIILRPLSEGWQSTLLHSDNAYGSLRLAGPAAWTPDGRQIVATNHDGALISIAAANGAVSTRPLATLGQQPADGPGDQLVAWRGDTPIVVIGNRVVLLSQPARTLITAPAGISELQIATALLTAPLRTPGPPDPGPFRQRYAHLISILSSAVAAVALLLVLFLLVRRFTAGRRARPSPRR